MIESVNQKQLEQFRVIFEEVKRSEQESVRAEMALCKFLGVLDLVQPSEAHIRLMSYTPESYLTALKIEIRNE